MSTQSKKETWQMIINIIISVLTAIATTLGVSSCMKPVASNQPQVTETSIVASLPSATNALQYAA